MYLVFVLSFRSFAVEVSPPLDKEVKKEESETTLLAKLSLSKAEKLFVKNNLLLLSAKFQIDAKKAAILQAGLYANPSIGIDQGIFRDGTDRYFDTTRSGQTAIQVQQLFLLGGKIDKRIKVAEINKAISEEMFYDLLRALKLQLRTSFFQLYYLKQAIGFYDESIVALQKTVSLADKSYNNRAILLSELLRLKALVFFLSNERTELMVQCKEKEANLRVLLNSRDLDNLEISPIIESNVLDNIPLDGLKVSNLIDIAFENRPDLKIAIQSVKLEEANIQLQNANAIPDIAFGPYYNRQGTAYPNYWGMTAQVTVPIFDRNQGNIQAAEKALLAKRAELQNTRIQVEHDISIIYSKAIEKNTLYNTFKDKFTEDYKKLSIQMIKNYEKRYLTIIEFADFFETYRTSILQMIKLQTDRVEAIEGLNYSVGKNILNIQSTME
ncbi:MAG: TolC family protein [Leptospiraceae bacterium]|nr:TolC family protein [Leptospiraceae bacterium]MCK6379861.1 TolC family protein [Leptospiraceae bacterium]NUM42437.1 TolC family protein [Leptospiraceae bacterium]